MFPSISSGESLSHSCIDGDFRNFDTAVMIRSELKEAGVERQGAGGRLEGDSDPPRCPLTAKSKILAGDEGPSWAPQQGLLCDETFPPASCLTRAGILFFSWDKTWGTRRESGQGSKKPMLSSKNLPCLPVAPLYQVSSLPES